VTGVLRFWTFFVMGSIASLVLGPISLVHPIQVWLMPLGPEKASHFIEALEVHLRRRHIENKKACLTLVIWPQKFPNDTLAKLYRREVFIIGPKQKLIARVLPFVFWRAIVINHDICRISIELARLRSFKRPIIPFTRNEIELGECLKQEVTGDKYNSFVLLGYPSIQYRKETDQKYHPNDDLITQLPETLHFVSAIKKLKSEGTAVVRQGLMLEESPELLAAGLVIPDYAKYPSGFVDVWLAAKCKFLLSACTGNWWFGMPFGKSAVLTDIYSPIGAFGVPGWHTIIFQLPLNLASNKFENFEWMTKNPRWCFDSKKLGTEYLVVKNSSEQIVDVVDEHLARLNGTWLETDEDKELQQRFQRLVFGKDTDPVYLPRVGAKFLRDHQHLLPD
jgi:putative glycosyltransferase (TIGR04372 family)